MRRSAVNASQSWTDPYITDSYPKTTSSVVMTSTKHYVICPKHGKVANFISSWISGHEGHWCQLCFLDMLGPPLEFIEEKQ